MPRRSNEFQALVTRINQSIGEKGVSLTDSAELPDRTSKTGKTREIDILIRKVVNEIEVLIGIECTEQSRPVDKEYVSQKFQMHQDVGISSSVIVSASGFTSGAVEFAEHYHMTLLTLEEAENAEWVDLVSRLGSDGFVAELIEITRIGGALRPENFEAEISGGSVVEFGGTQTTVYELCKRLASHLVRKEPSEELLKSTIESDVVSEHNFTVECDPPLKIVDSVVEDAEIVRLEIEFKITLQHVVVNLESGRYGNSEMAFTRQPVQVGSSEVFYTAKMDSETKKANVLLQISEPETRA